MENILIDVDKMLGIKLAEVSELLKETKSEVEALTSSIEKLDAILKRMTN